MPSPYAPRMAEPFVLRERWFDVSFAEFEAFLRDYPRPLEARPPLPQKGNYREWVDPSLGAWPGNAVGDPGDVAHVWATRSGST
jgi:hypothetical protein